MLHVPAQPRRRDGSAWWRSGLDGDVRSLVVWDGFIVAGDLLASGKTPVRHVAVFRLRQVRATEAE